jgi:hypothetical protein
MSDAAAYFNDPLDPPRSLQLNNRYWKGETFTHLDMLREADDDINNRRLVSLRKSLKRVKSLLPAKFHYSFLSKLVYSMIYRVSFEPIRFSIKLSDGFLSANSFDGRESVAYKTATQTGELKYIVDLAHSIYRDKYGIDVLSSKFELRYMNSTNVDSVNRMTRFGDFSDFHLDAGKDFTCVIYLCHVGADNGCFTYLDGTGSLHKSHLLRALHQVVNFDMGLSTPDQLSPLPLELRGGAIGDLLDDEKRDRLRDACVHVLGDTGDGIIFNGFDLLHRGGKPVRGERTSLFISTTGHLHMRLKKYAYDLLAYLWL